VDIVPYVLLAPLQSSMNFYQFFPYFSINFWKIIHFLFINVTGLFAKDFWYFSSGDIYEESNEIC